jgi:uncharacterized membrane protein
MADYPKQYIAQLDAACTKEAWPLIGFFILDLIAMAVALYIVGQIANSL